MSHPRLRKPRPLGSIRQITKNVPPAQTEKLSVIPHILPEIHKDSEKLKAGIHGNAMAVPPPYVETTARESSRNSSGDRPRSDKSKSSNPPKSAVSSTSVVSISHEHCEKEIKDGIRREKDLKDQISLLQKQTEELQLALRGKEDEVTTLQTKLQDQETEYQTKLQAAESAHEVTRLKLAQVEILLQDRNDLIGRMGKEHAEALAIQRKEMEKKLEDTISTKDAEIADRDHKLSRLKSQMAEALKGNSWERQQQLEELTKELSRIQEECDLLRMKIKSMNKSKQSNCSNCNDTNAKLAKSQASIKEKEGTIKELKSLCSKFETQLSQQDKLLEQWAASKGQKIPAPK